MYYYYHQPTLDKPLMLEKIEGRRREHQRMKWLNSITNAMDMNLSKLGDGEGQGGLACCSPQGLQRVVHNWVTEQQQAITIIQTF